MRMVEIWSQFMLMFVEYLNGIDGEGVPYMASSTAVPCCLLPANFPCVIYIISCRR